MTTPAEHEPASQALFDLDAPQVQELIDSYLAGDQLDQGQHAQLQTALADPHWQNVFYQAAMLEARLRQGAGAWTATASASVEAPPSARPARPAQRWRSIIALAAAILTAVGITTAAIADARHSSAELVFDAERVVRLHVHGHVGHFAIAAENTRRTAGVVEVTRALGSGMINAEFVSITRASAP